MKSSNASSVPKKAANISRSPSPRRSAEVEKAARAGTKLQAPSTPSHGIKK